VTHATCPDQVCVHTAPAKSPGNRSSASRITSSLSSRGTGATSMPLPNNSAHHRTTQATLRFALLAAVAIVINYFDPPLPFLPGPSWASPRSADDLSGDVRPACNCGAGFAADSGDRAYQRKSHDHHLEPVIRRQHGRGHRDGAAAQGVWQAYRPFPLRVYNHRRARRQHHKRCW